MNHIVWVVFDSARYDAFMAASTPHLDRIAAAERRFSFASWTAPSHYTFLMGVMPHGNARDVFASVQYRQDLLRWSGRMGLPGGAFRFESFLPGLSLPMALKQSGYRCEAYVSLPVLNPETLLGRHFDHYELMPEHNDLRRIVSRLRFDGPPCFFFINTGETHYPYLLPGETAEDLPRISGLNGTLRGLDEFLRNPASIAECEHPSQAFTPQRFRALWEKQVAGIEHLDRVMGELLEKAPRETWFIVTSDHGELFGEDGLFGHGPIMHEKVFEVFFLEGPHP
jgi:hypothetical protein